MKILPFLLPLLFAAIWIGAAVFFGYPGFIAVALSGVVIAFIAIIAATRG